ncbi:hypothetical protein TNCV_4595001 [Trichonephila clavipes]|uniref:Uncharacterized protein n=1 Tax=Trichonephila clavipes TaxID=2585209 RepID=A0A8X6WEY4_TRICX|nr:hypothetical protein TNCV_4595001 [Trichonephila clavipes]
MRAFSMVARSNSLGILAIWRIRVAFKSGKVLIPPLQTRSFRNLHNQKSQGYESVEREGHESGKYPDNHDKLAPSSTLTWRPMGGVAPCCIKIVVCKHCRS